MYLNLITEATIRGVLLKKVFLKISEIFKEASVLESRFNKVAGLKAC